MLSGIKTHEGAWTPFRTGPHDEFSIFPSSVRNNSRSAACTGAFVSILWSHFSFKLTQNCLPGRFFSDEIYEYVFHVFAIWGRSGIFNEGQLPSQLCVFQRCSSPKTLADICRNIGVCGVFKAVATRKTYNRVLCYYPCHIQRVKSKISRKFCWYTS